ncbi:MAG: serine hydrolase domain-containing protein [Planctomycetota bacterium]
MLFGLRSSSILIACVFLLANGWQACSLVAQQESGPKVAEGTSPKAIAKKRFAAVDELLESAVEDEKVIGHSALIFHQGKEIYYGDFGDRNARKSLPLQRDTIFRIYSMSKPITSVATMQLVEQGKIDLDAPISKYIPALGKVKVYDDGELVDANREMTPRDLLRHTSGLTYGFFGNTEVDQQYRKKGIMITDTNIEGTVEKLSTVPLLHQPGERFHYSVSTDVLGRLVEVASGERFDDYLKKNIFDPLKMNDTFFTVPKDKQERFSQIYQGRDGNLKPKNAFASYRFLNENDLDSGGGGLCSTIDDYLTFCKMLLNEGKLGDAQIIKPDTLKQMFTNQLDTKRRSSFEFGLGFRCFPEGDFGWGGAAGTRFWVNPEKDLAILYMVQINPYGNRKWGNRVRSLVYETLD